MDMNFSANVSDFTVSNSRLCAVADIVFTFRIWVWMNGLDVPQITNRFIKKPLMAVNTPVGGIRSVSLRLRAGVGTGREIITQMRQVVRTGILDSRCRRLFLPVLFIATHERFSFILG
jgi:hypothetical protein